MNHNEQHLEMVEQQEPVAWYDAEKDCAYTLSDCEGRAQDDLDPLYLAPPNKPWQGLTDAQRRETVRRAWNEYQRDGGHDSFSWYLSLAVEAKLKEKNT